MGGNIFINMSRFIQMMLNINSKKQPPRKKIFGFKKLGSKLKQSKER